jgi:N-acetylglucosaminyl-diphospho-decaprenol L-rhamnosyltransferase
MPARVSIVIVNFNARAHLERCLASIAHLGPDCPVVVVDNASSDGSEAAAAAFRVNWIRNDRNLGFARAVNQGVAASGGEAVLLLNPDCRIHEGAVERLVVELERHPECAIAAPQILDEDGGVQGSVRGDPNLLTGLFGRKGLLRRLFPGSAIARRNVTVQTGRANGPAAGDDQVGGTADWVSGACMLMRRAAFDAVGGLDERYFLYWEDADLCRRLRDAGHTIRYVPEARVEHAVGQSSRTAAPLAIRAFHESAFIYYTTHVARSRTARWFARLVLMARCRWKLLSFRVFSRRT